jgi:hypothetical protein
MRALRFLALFLVLAASLVLPQHARAAGSCDSGVDWVANNPNNVRNNPGYPPQALFASWSKGIAAGCVDATGDGSKDACKAVDQGRGWFEISCLVADKDLRGSILRTIDQREYTGDLALRPWFVTMPNGHPAFCRFAWAPGGDRLACLEFFVQKDKERTYLKLVSEEDAGFYSDCQCQQYGSIAHRAACSAMQCKEQCEAKTETPSSFKAFDGKDKCPANQWLPPKK